METPLPKEHRRRVINYRQYVRYEEAKQQDPAAVRRFEEKAEASRRRKTR